MCASKLWRLPFSSQLSKMSKLNVKIRSATPASRARRDCLKSAKSQTIRLKPRQSLSSGDCTCFCTLCSFLQYFWYLHHVFSILKSFKWGGLRSHAQLYCICKRVISLKNENSVIIYSTLCHSKRVGYYSCGWNTKGEFLKNIHTVTCSFWRYIPSLLKSYNGFVGETDWIWGRNLLSKRILCSVYSNWPNVKWWQWHCQLRELQRTWNIAHSLFRPLLWCF